MLVAYKARLRTFRARSPATSRQNASVADDIMPDDTKALADDRMELTILMPCLDEAETVATCVGKATGFLRRAGIAGEVLVADNGSTDGSQRLAEDAGGRVVAIAERGYGSALLGGIRAARGASSFSPTPTTATTSRVSMLSSSA
jgi:hypothetical protein